MGLGAAAAAILAYALTRGEGEGVTAHSEGAARLPKLRAEPQPADLPPAREAPVEAQVARVMQMWRESILGKDADGVLSCDRAFRDRPAIFTAALRESATSDENERVRAFSTRMLGKIGDPANTDLFAKLLTDPSPYVRGNAAWAIGVVGTQHQHRAALERLARTDKVPLVRQRATDALKTTTLAERGKPRKP